ncbi:MAG: PilZ domain-containing protein [Pseudomonadota bacterium]
MTANTGATRPNASPARKAPPSQRDDHAERRLHARTDIKIRARYLTAPGEEHACLVSNISAGGALLRAKTPPGVGEKVVVYIDDVGRFEGRVVRSGAHTFAVDYRSRRSKSKRTADALIEAINTTGRRFDRRSAPRIKTESDATLVLPDGQSLPCSIKDISLTGASIDVEPQPPLGTPVKLGKMMAKIVRRHDRGVGVVFTGPASSGMEEVFTKTGAGEAGKQAAGGEHGAKVATRFGRNINSA